MTEYTPTEAEVRNNMAFGASCATAGREFGGEALLDAMRNIDWPAPGVREWHKGAFDRWLAEVRREAAEQAWDEGYLRGTLDATSDLEPADNPYRKDAP